MSEEVTIPGEPKIKCKKGLFKKKKRFLTLTYDCNLEANRTLCEQNTCLPKHLAQSSQPSQSSRLGRKIGRTALGVASNIPIVKGPLMVAKTGLAVAKPAIALTKGVGKIGLSMGKFIGRKALGSDTQKGGYYEKYIKYKMKYLKLRDELDE